MVRGRLIPTSYFRDPDVMSLSSGDVRLILVGLVLQADDWGRGLAHAVILGRDLDYAPDTIEATLAELELADLVQCYQGGKHRYYVLTRWDDWQKLPLNKRTPSRLPAPPMAESAETPSQNFPDFPRKNPGNPENSGENPPESESNQNPSRIRIEDEETQPPPNVLPFPVARADADAAASEKMCVEATKQVAAILKLPLTDDLLRVVADYLGHPGLSLLGEADAAAEWLGDIAPHLLDEDTRTRLQEAKRRAVLREAAEALIPRQLWYTRGWPTVLPSRGEASLLANVRRQVAEILGLAVEYTEPEAVLERYSYLMEVSARRQNTLLRQEDTCRPGGKRPDEHTVSSLPGG